MFLTELTTAAFRVAMDALEAVKSPGKNNLTPVSFGQPAIDPIVDHDQACKEVSNPTSIPNVGNKCQSTRVSALPTSCSF